MLQRDPATAFARPPKQLPMADLCNATLVSVHVGRTSSARRSGTKKTMSCPMTEEFKVPRGLLCAHSKYFDSLFRKQFAESKSLRSQLSDVEPWVFRCFLGWLYTGAIYYDFDSAVFSPPHQHNVSTTNANEDDDDEDLGANPITWPLRDLFELYVFADEYDAREFRMSVMDLIQTKVLQREPQQYGFPKIQEIRYITSHLPASSALLRFLADAWHSLMMIPGCVTDLENDEQTSEMQEEMASFPHAFLVLCTRAAVRNALAMACPACGIENDGDREWDSGSDFECKRKDHGREDRLDLDHKDWCVYHEHGDDGEEKAQCQERWAKIDWRRF